MKTWLWMLGFVVMGTVGGALLAMLTSPATPELLFPDIKAESKVQSAGPKAASVKSIERKADVPEGGTQDEKEPRVEIDEETYDFGVMEDNRKGHHEFIFENVGTAPLKVKVISTTCKCTKGEIEKSPIGPGEKTKLILEWDPKGYTGDFGQTVIVSTNDPVRPSISLKVKGRILAPMALVPRTIVLGQITNRQDVDGTARLYLFEEKDTQIAGVEFENKETESYFDADIEKLTLAEVETQPDAEAGWAIHIRLKPGMDQGSIRQTVQIKTDSEKLGKIDLPIEGKVVGNVSVYGAGWNEDRSVLRLGVVDGKQGVKKNLAVVTRNVAGQLEPLHIASVTPSGILNASLSEPVTGSSGKVTHAKLTIEIPPGSPAANYIGSKQAPTGHILLESQRPDGPKLDVRVSFVVENK